MVLEFLSRVPVVLKKDVKDVIDANILDR